MDRIQIVKELYAAFGSKDEPRLRELLAPEVENRPTFRDRKWKIQAPSRFFDASQMDGTRELLSLVACCVLMNDERQPAVAPILEIGDQHGKLFPV